MNKFTKVFIVLLVYVTLSIYCFMVGYSWGLEISNKYPLEIKDEAYYERVINNGN